MPYTDHFRLADDYILHLDTLMGGIADPFIQSRYLGFVLISAVTVYELAIKEVFYTFADKKHLVLGEFARAKFSRLNGRIMSDDLTSQHICMFGKKYVTKFNATLKASDDASLRAGNGSVKESYNNVIRWRHAFVHRGSAPTTTNYAEIKQAYTLGKNVIHCLEQSMRR